MPAGLQFGPPEELPQTSSWTGALASTDDGSTTVILGFRFVGGNHGAVTPAVARALVGNPDSGWQDVAMDSGRDFPEPSGYSELRFGITPTNIAYGPEGFVAVGGGIYFNDGGTATSVGAIWHSADGLSWQRINAGDVVGAKLLRLQSVVATPDGYIAAGKFSDGPREQSSIAILASADGVAWRQAATIDGTWSLDPASLYAVGDALFLHGVQYACATDSDVQTFTFAPQSRMWRSMDGGATWELVDLTGSGVMGETEPAPQDEADCPSSGFERNDRFRTLGAWLGFAGDTAIVADQARVALSTDLATWRVVELPGSEPAGGSRGQSSRRVTLSGSDIVIISIENWRDSRDFAREEARQALGWLIPPGASEATPLPRPRPFLSGGSMRQGPNEEVWLIAHQEANSGLDRPQGLTTLSRSVAGPLLPWGTCAAAPLADCAFATLEGDMPGADLHGIDLSAATVNGDLSGANLTGAKLDGASIYGDLEGADLTAASAKDVYMSGSMVGAILSGVDLTGGRTNATIFDAETDGATLTDLVVWIETGQTLAGHDFSGQNLASLSFHAHSDAAGTLQGANFSNADLRGSSFSGIDLTGADFSGAKLKGGNFVGDVYFGTDVICPDGQPVDTSKFGAASCRIK